jgi:DNA-binding PadR family transcriptional regulator
MTYVVQTTSTVISGADMRDIRLREFEELVLLGVLVAGAGAYGASIQRVLDEEAGRAVTLGAIYTALERLTRKGLVRSEMGDPTPVQGGRRRRHYELTPAGLRQVTHIRRIRERLWRKAGVDPLGEGVGR